MSEYLNSFNFPFPNKVKIRILSLLYACNMVLTGFSDRRCYFQIAGRLKLGMSASSAYNTALTTWSSWVQNMIDTNRTRVFFRTFEPSHWRCVKLVDICVIKISLYLHKIVNNYKQLFIGSHFLNSTSNQLIIASGRIFPTRLMQSHLSVFLRRHERLHLHLSVNTFFVVYFNRLQCDKKPPKRR